METVADGSIMMERTGDCLVRVDERIGKVGTPVARFASASCGQTEGIEQMTESVAYWNEKARRNPESAFEP